VAKALPNPSEVRHIGIVRLSALGDVVMFSALIPLLRQCYPQARITWVVSQPAAAMLEDIDDLALEVIDKPRRLRDYLTLRRRLRHYRFDLLICGQASLRANLIYPLIRARYKLGWGGRRARDGHRWFVDGQIADADEHLQEGFLRFAWHLAGARQPHQGWPLALTDAESRQAAVWLEPRPTGERLVAINPCASKPERNWPADRYAELIRSIQAQQLGTVVLTGGPSDQEQALAAELEQGAKAPLINLVGRTRPKQLAAVLARCDLLIAPDTGPAHVAVAVGTPVVGLYAVARPELSGPYQQPDWTVNKYPQAVARWAPDKTADWHYRVHDAAAMELIDVAEVLQHVADCLNRPHAAPADASQ